MPDSQTLYYVGRAGDESIPNAASPFKRLGIHLDVKAKGNCLWRLLHERELDSSKCHFQMACYGPVFKEVKNMKEHKPYRDRAAGMERALMEWFEKRNLTLLNKVRIRRPLLKKDLERFDTLAQAIANELAIYPD